MCVAESRVPDGLSTRPRLNVRRRRKRGFPPRSPTNPLPASHSLVVGVGSPRQAASARCLLLFKNLPCQTGMAFVVIDVHPVGQLESQLHEIIGRVSDMPVMQVRELVAIEPNACLCDFAVADAVDG